MGYAPLLSAPLSLAILKGRSALMACVETSPSSDPRQQQFEQSLHFLEQSLLTLKARYSKVKAHQQRRLDLEQHRHDLEAQWQLEQLPDLEKDLQALQEQQQALELELESELLTNTQLQTLFWQGLRQGILGDAFWQILRFGGLGLVLGWLLKAWAG
ncbi:hypothetical protein [Synechocystis sp. LKSZ1]|uniref:hypothetical protein n=1 Tax=Synechocystis sp. LKSZ1 TaxID=3144951 RepID=UPI00336BCD77